MKLLLLEKHLFFAGRGVSSRPPPGGDLNILVISCFFEALFEQAPRAHWGAEMSSKATQGPEKCPESSLWRSCGTLLTQSCNTPVSGPCSNTSIYNSFSTGMILGGLEWGQTMHFFAYWGSSPPQIDPTPWTPGSIYYPHFEYYIDRMVHMFTIFHKIYASSCWCACPHNMFGLWDSSQLS